MIPYFVFFFLSGFCSLVYQVVWLRVAMAGFGVTTPLVSIVLSWFMAGLALGSWAAGRLVKRFEGRPAAFFVRSYGAVEVVIGVSGLVVAPLLRSGHALLGVQHANWGSSTYYLASAGWIGLIMAPFCVAMGATFPVAMAAIRAAFGGQAPRSFSYLYVANVLGAMSGTLGSAFVFIELMGFSKTLFVAVACNALIAVLAFALAAQAGSWTAKVSSAPSEAPASRAAAPVPLALPLLFTTGLISLAMEVVWTRQFIPFLGPVVYSFAAMLATYLAATALGTAVYRGTSAARSPAWQPIVILAAAAALLPLFAADPRIPEYAAFRVVLGIGPFCALVGFLTPLLVDRFSLGDPSRAGRAYAVNALGCILGPLLSGFLLLPTVGERTTLILLSLPLFAFGVAGIERARAVRLLAPPLAAAVLLVAATRDFTTLYPGALVRRDHTATVIATGHDMGKQLLINGVGITKLTPITKMMAHLPLASLDKPPANALVLCFGMGTSFRSALSWGIPVTVVELVPSVPQLVGFFHRDGEALLRSPRATVVIDDARRYLERTRDSFDVIVIDPPPPIEAAGSSMLYSTEFYQILARRLRPGGILQQWLPFAELTVLSSFAQALQRSFPYVRCHTSVEGWGIHFLASFTPLPPRTAAGMAARMPPEAVRDLLEWGPETDPQAQFQTVLETEIPLATLIAVDPSAPVLTDDRPVNEYYLLRRGFGPGDWYESSP